MLRRSQAGGTSPEYWLNLQRNVDLRDAACGLKREIAHIHPLQGLLPLAEARGLLTDEDVFALVL